MTKLLSNIYESIHKIVVAINKKTPMVKSEWGALKPDRLLSKGEFETRTKEWLA